MRPATRIGDIIIFPSGAIVRISWWQRTLFMLRIKTTMKKPTTFGYWSIR